MQMGAPSPTHGPHGFWKGGEWALGGGALAVACNSTMPDGDGLLVLPRATSTRAHAEPPFPPLPRPPQHPHPHARTYTSGIDYKTSTKVTAADLASKTLTTASGDKISYDKLIIATGARVRPASVLLAV